jgi:hypothetical protein
MRVFKEPKMAAAAIVPPPEPAALSEPQRVVDTFIAPTKTFADLRRNASWWGPFLLITITSLLFIYVVDQKVGFRKVAENLMQLQPKQAERVENLAADQRQKVMHQQEVIIKIGSYAVPALALFFYAIIAAVLFGTVKLGAGADVKYKTMFALVLYTRLPEILRGLLATLSLVAGVSTDAFNLRNPVATNPGYLIEPSGSAVLRALLTPIDVITIWTLILLAIGIACISKVKRGTAFAIVFGWYAFFMLARVVIAVATS